MICRVVRAIYSLAYNTPNNDNELDTQRKRETTKERGREKKKEEEMHLLSAKFTRIEINRATDWLFALQSIRWNLSRQLFPL